MSRSLYLSSLVVTADPNRLDIVQRAISDLKCAEVAIADPSGKLIVTLEAEDEPSLIEGLSQIQLLPGVASAALCYHHSEEGKEVPNADP